MARKKPRFQVDEPIPFNPRSKKPHIAMEYFDSGKITDAWNLVAGLRRKYAVAVIGTTKGMPHDHSRGAGRRRQDDIGGAVAGGVPLSGGG